MTGWIHPGNEYQWNCLAHLSESEAVDDLTIVDKIPGRAIKLGNSYECYYLNQYPVTVESIEELECDSTTRCRDWEFIRVDTYN